MMRALVLAALIGLAAALALLRLKVGVMPLLASCAVAGLIVRLALGAA